MCEENLDCLMLENLIFLPQYAQFEFYGIVSDKSYWNIVRLIIR